MAATIAILASSCGEGGNCLAKKTSCKVGEALSGLAASVKDEPLKVELSEAAIAKGLKMTITKRAAFANPSEKGITVYIISSKSVGGQLLVKAFDKAGQEIGRASAELELNADDARYFTFKFSPEMDFQSADKFLVDVRK